MGNRPSSVEKSSVASVPSVIAIQPSPLVNGSNANRFKCPRRLHHISTGGVSVVFEPSYSADDRSGASSSSRSTSWHAAKSEVLQYLSRTDCLRLHGCPGGDMQITDQQGLLLLDAWLDIDFVHKLWRLEAYGKTVLNIREPLIWCSTEPAGRASSTIYDWSGEFFGAVVSGEPMLIISNERRVVAKVNHRKLVPCIGPITPISLDASLHTPEILSSVDEVANNSSRLLDGVGYHRERNADREAIIVNNDPDPEPGPYNMKPHWLCTSAEPDNRQLARMEDMEITFNPNVSLNVKLLILAAMIRIVGHRSPTHDLIKVIKYAFTCCANVD